LPASLSISPSMALNNWPWSWSWRDSFDIEIQASGNTKVHVVAKVELAHLVATFERVLLIGDTPIVGDELNFTPTQCAQIAPLVVTGFRMLNRKPLIIMDECRVGLKGTNRLNTKRPPISGGLIVRCGKSQRSGGGSFGSMLPRGWAAS
jgi:hypothetical protein